MRKELDSSIRGIKDTIKISILEGDVAYFQVYLDFARHLRSRKGAVGYGILTGLAAVMGEWKIATGIAGLSIFYKAIGEGDNTYEQRLGQVLDRKREEIKRLKEDSKET